MRFHSSRQSGFTLIELLVVVGIISILATVAIPNYMEALTKSKVAAFKMNVKACETGIEVFNADNGRYPNADRWPVQITRSDWNERPVGPDKAYLTRRLTTPVAYLSVVPVDPFRNTKDADQRFGDAYNAKDPEKSQKEGFTMMYSNDMQNKFAFNDPYVGWVYTNLKRDDKLSSAIWMINSPGPDGKLDNDRNDPIQYDATNGTISDGDLFYFGPGFGFGLDQ